MSHRPEDTFHSECGELLDGMESVLLALEKDPEDQENINELFRAMHTVKGTAGIFAFEQLEAFTHVVESMLVQVRSGDIKINAQFIALMFRCSDHVHKLVDLAVNEEKASKELLGVENELLKDVRDFVKEFGEMFEEDDDEIEGEEREVRIQVEQDAPVASNYWHLSLRFQYDVLQHGMDPKSFISYLGKLGKLVHIHTTMDLLPDLDQIDPLRCYLGFELSLESEESAEDITEVFEFVQEMASIIILPPKVSLAQYCKLIQQRMAETTEIGEILVECQSLTAQELQHAMDLLEDADNDVDRIQELLQDQKEIHQAVSQEKQKAKSKNDKNSTLRVSADRLDGLINLVGELVISGASANLIAQRINDEALTESLSQISRLVEEIRDQTLTLRMVPISDTFNRFKRIVRDYCNELGKDIHLEISGAETELDKTVVEKISDPLMHLVRNAIDHGIESANERLRIGKTKQGLLQLNAFHESGSIVIEVYDDGKGLSRENILSRAKAKGLIGADQELTDKEMYNLVFEPGFSTANEVTKISGRGVGMDVVKRNIEALRGTLDLESVAGKGTRVSIRLPLTLAIIDGFLVGVGDSSYVIPLDMVLECIELEEGQRAEEHLQSYINLRGEVLPFLRLSELFSDGHGEGKRENIVVVEYANQKIGVVVDELFGEFQTVIKPLGKVLQKLSGVSGATILGNGNVALILDVPNLVQRTMRAFELANKETIQ